MYLASAPKGQIGEYGEMRMDAFNLMAAGLRKQETAKHLQSDTDWFVAKGPADPPLLFLFLFYFIFIFPAGDGDWFCL